MWWRSLWWRLRLRWRLWWCPLGRRSVLIVRILEVELWRCCLWLESLCCLRLESWRHLWLESVCRLRLECGSLWIESCRRPGLGACLWSTFALVSFRLTFRWVITSHCNVSQLHREVQGLCSCVWLVCWLRCQSAERSEAEVGASGPLPLKRKSAAYAAASIARQPVLRV